jgi:hypothetical protein
MVSGSAPRLLVIRYTTSTVFLPFFVTVRRGCATLGCAVEPDPGRGEGGLDRAAGPAAEVFGHGRDGGTSFQGSQVRERLQQVRMTTGHNVRASAALRADVERKAEIVRVLMEAGNAVEAIVAQVLAEFEVPASVAGVLWALTPGTEPPTMRNVAARLHCDPSTASLAADTEGTAASAPWP